MPTTTRLSLRYPSTSDSADVPRDIGNLASDLDNAAIFSKGTLAARPTSTVGSPGIDGRYYYATDNTTLYLDTGTSWVTVGGVSDGSITAAKFDSTIAGYLGVSSGATTRRWTDSDTTERTTTSTSFVDVTGISVSIDDVIGNLTIVTATCELKNPEGGAIAAINIDAPTSRNGNAFNTGGNTGSGGALWTFGTENTSPMYVDEASYYKQQQTVIYTAPATRTTTAKVQFKRSIGGTAYIKNVTLNAWTITP